MKTYRLATAAIAVLVAAIGRADIAYNNFGSGDSFNESDWHPIGGNREDFYQAMSFVSATTGILSLIKLALIPENVYTVSINNDNNGVPGDARESWVTGSSANTLSVAGDGSVSLDAGVRYWVEVAPYDAPNGGWYLSNDATGLAADSDGPPPPWTPYTGMLGAFRVETSSVPEPTSATALAVGVGVAIARRRTKA